MHSVRADHQVGGDGTPVREADHHHWATLLDADRALPKAHAGDRAEWHSMQVAAVNVQVRRAVCPFDFIPKRKSQGERPVLGGKAAPGLRAGGDGANLGQQAQSAERHGGVWSQLQARADASQRPGPLVYLDLGAGTSQCGRSGEPGLR